MLAGATFTGRLVDAEGKPRGEVDLRVEARPKGGRAWEVFHPEGVTPDRGGRFRAGPLLPGHEYRLVDAAGELACGEAPGAGATKDLGNVTTKRATDE